MSVATILLIVLVILLLGGFSGIGGGPFYGTGYTAAAGWHRYRDFARPDPHGTPIASRV